MISGEYLVLDGALALAVPTRFGQSLTVRSKDDVAGKLQWESYTQQGECWFSGLFSLPEGTYLEGTDTSIGQRLEQILRAGKELQPLLWTKLPELGYAVRTDLEFPRNWGLGTSSTLIANLAKWWELDPYQLLGKTFGGSGYDLACAHADGPIFYRRKGPEVTSVAFYPTFHDQLYFLFLEQKQNSRSGIASYRKKGKPTEDLFGKIDSISNDLSKVGNFMEFLGLLEEHERIISQWMETERVKSSLFPDFPGAIKSLGAWGGDFVLVASGLSPAQTKKYFTDKGYSTLIPFAEMVLSRENASPNSN